MKDTDVKQLFEKHRALLSGHFLLSSGLHSDTYFQSALILQHPAEAEKVAGLLADKVLKEVPDIDVVVSPAIGGIVIGQEVAAQIGCRAIFCERVDGMLLLRRGFTVEKGEKCLLVEDVITTGLSTREVIQVVEPLGGQIACVVSLVDRSGGKVDFGCPRFSLLSLEVKSYKPEECPMCLEGGTPVKPGSRSKK
jgi:orotate phosphoribosyltransferase